MSARVERPTLESAVGRHASDIRQEKRTPGEWIYVGTYPGDPGTTIESPPFQNGWGNTGGPDDPLASFYMNKTRHIFYRGKVTGGSIPSVMFTVPPAYRPNKEEEFACSDGAGGIAIIRVSPNGDVARVA